MSPGQIRQSFPITVWHLKLQVTPGDLKKKKFSFLFMSKSQQLHGA